LLSNVRIQQRDGGLLDVRLNFWVYRSRLERHQDWFVGERFDVLVPDNGPYGYRIADRKIVLEQSTILAPNISVFL
jgi:3-phenylpropionate/cinnamic acid dioxygenase small subunit